MLPATGAIDPHAVQQPLFSRLRNISSVKVNSLLGLVALGEFELLLVEAPERGDFLATPHAPDRNNHAAYSGGRRRGGGQIYCGPRVF